jgi:hypothetical protein
MDTRFAALALRNRTHPVFKPALALSPQATQQLEAQNKGAIIA